MKNKNYNFLITTLAKSGLPNPRFSRVNMEIPNCGRPSTFSMETLISCDVRNKFFSSGNGLNRMVMAFENGVFCPILNLPGPSLNGTSAVTSHRRHAIC